MQALLKSDILLLSDLQSGLMLASAWSAGLAAGWLTYSVLGLVNRRLPTAIESWQFEASRRDCLRKRNEIYRWFEPLIDELKDFRWLKWAGRLDEIRRYLQTGASLLPWTAEEYLSMKVILGILLGSLAGGLAIVFGASWMFAGLVLALFAMGYPWMASLWLGKQSLLYLRRFKNQLPFAVDQMALMMEVGADFRESMATVVREHQGHPVADQFHLLLLGLARGQTLQDALQQFDKRIADDDVHEMLGAIKRADDLGQPLARLFLDLANQMRLKRSQWAETAAGKAQANVTFPGMLVMIACLIIAVAPFLLVAMDPAH
jgi:Flp pilus assembly protein TadB